MDILEANQVIREHFKQNPQEFKHFVDLFEQYKFNGNDQLVRILFPVPNIKAETLLKELGELFKEHSMIKQYYKLKIEKILKEHVEQTYYVQAQYLMKELFGD